MLAVRQRLQSTSILWVLLGLFVTAGLVHYWNADGEDLASSFLGCRLLSNGHPEALFNYDPDNFAGIGPGDMWQKIAAQGGFTGYIHPYVQTPLWAEGLRPLCDHTRFPAFSRVFCLLVMLCFAGSLWLAARDWAPSFRRPIPMAIVLLGLWFSQPFGYAMFLMQTHALFFFLTIASLIAAERDKPILAGFLLACATAVKVTPVFLLLYWLFTRRWKAGASMIAWSALLMLVTVFVVGTRLTSTYFADLHRISEVLLVAQNNQSLAASWMGHFYPSDAIFDIDILPLPKGMRLGSLALTVGFTALGGWIDQRREMASRRFSSETNDAFVQASLRAPLGAMMALVAATIFAPIAWTHYFVILVVPIMLLYEQSRYLRSWTLACLIVAAILLNFRPLATDIINMDVGTLAIVRAQFYAGLLCLVALAIAAWQAERSVRSPLLPLPRGTNGDALSAPSAHIGVSALRSAPAGRS